MWIFLNTFLGKSVLSRSRQQNLKKRKKKLNKSTVATLLEGNKKW